MDPSRSGLSVLPNSPYAAELERAAARQRFSPQFEAQYLRARLHGHRTLIRAACALAVLLTLFRGGHHVLAGTWDEAQMGLLAVVLSTSVALAAIAWSRAFERWYLTVAQILVPLRNWLAAAGVTAAAANGHVEALMILPLMVLGPFFFMGLPLRVAALAVAVMIGCFGLAAPLFGLPTTVTISACVFLLLAAVISAIGCRELEKASRRSFLERRMIAQLAEHDALTGLKNRRVFDETLDRLWEQAADSARTIAILLIDVDHFKAYNDLYGHQAGDRTLRRVADSLRGAAAVPLDVLARYGGEEFAVVLYAADATRAEALAGSLRRAIEEADIAHRESRHGGVVTISIGVAVVEPSNERRARGALQLADQALYQAKQLGRNRVVVLDQAEHGLLVTGVFARQSFAVE
jgi:diguanylate cyclase (GGDEF)-like protein